MELFVTIAAKQLPLVRAQALHLPKECQTHGFPFTDPGSTLTPPRMIVTEIQAASCFDT